MEKKAKYTFEQKLQAVLDYQSGKKSATFLKTLSKENYDIVFLDIDMPDENGIVIACRLCNIDHPLVVIFVTSIENISEMLLVWMYLRLLLKRG